MSNSPSSFCSSSSGSGASQGSDSPGTSSSRIATSAARKSNVSRHRTRPTPHGQLTLHKIARIKMVDRHSCYVAGIQREIATKEILEKPSFFGQFGQITSLRVLRDRDPAEVYIRFASDFDAVRAINWCNGQAALGISAEHGYQKYCIKFIDGKRCNRPGCPHRHSWAPNEDILPSATEIAQAQCTRIPSAVKTRVAAPRLDQSMMSLESQFRAQFADLEMKFRAQQDQMQQLLFHVDQLRTENARLRTENKFLSLVPGPVEGHEGPDKLIMTGLVHQQPMFDEHLVNEIVEEVFAQ